MTAHVHMICGLTGAGKSTYAERLRQDSRAVRFSIDEWNRTLFFMDRDPTSDFQWFFDRVQRCCAQMRDTADHILTTDTPVVFDCGFTNQTVRQIFYDWAEDGGYAVTLHYLDVDETTCWNRVQQRNSERGETYMLEVTRDMFDFMASIWGAPDGDEMARVNGQHVMN